MNILPLQGANGLVHISLPKALPLGCCGWSWIKFRTQWRTFSALPHTSSTAKQYRQSFRVSNYGKSNSRKWRKRCLTSLPMTSCVIRLLSGANRFLTSFGMTSAFFKIGEWARGGCATPRSLFIPPCFYGSFRPQGEIGRLSAWNTIHFGIIIPHE